MTLTTKRDMKRTIATILLSLPLVILAAQADGDRLSLAGKWGVWLDSTDVGMAAKELGSLTDSISLPGTLCDAGYGTPCTLKPAMTKEVFQNLKRKYDYVGAAWYNRQVDIPKSWKDKRIFLRLERVQWTSVVWVNGTRVDGMHESLSVPHCYELTRLLHAGKTNTVSIRIDNRKQHDMSVRDMAHAYTNETQTLWNGILGDISLTAKPDAHIEQLTLTPDVDGGRVRVAVRLSATKALPRRSRLTLTLKTPDGQVLPAKTVAVDSMDVETELPVPDAQLWDEYSPKLYSLTAELATPRGSDISTSTFGMRKLSTDDALLHINGRRLFLRGTLESCVFPLTGYPPTDEAGWLKVFQRARQYGLNHLRFHSWCPPEAAFTLADKMGFYLQIELPVWTLNLGADRPTTDFLRREALDIVRTYGNHPSFCFLSMGNELEGDFGLLHDMVSRLRAIDGRHLYTSTTFTFQKGHGGWPESVDDYFITQQTNKGWVRGQGVFEDKTPTFNTDYSASIEGLPVPIVSHEIGQYSVYPDLGSIGKYTGNLIPLNFMSVADDLRRKGRLGMAGRYTSATCQFATLLYKEEIERALRTPKFSGFQLLGLSDYPGQSTALVGVVDVFWDDKAADGGQGNAPCDAATFSSFCSDIVPLATFDKAVYLNDETFTANLQVANFSATTLGQAVVEWTLSDTRGTVVASGETTAQDIKIGSSDLLGQISVPLESVHDASQLTLSVRLRGTARHNSWKIWVYPKQLPETATDVVYTRQWSEAQAALAKGRNVLFNPELKDVKGVKGRFLPVFWSPVHFPDQPGTMGILCRPEHPALTHFPTEEHSDWQWRDICVNAVTMNLDGINGLSEPIVGMVDNFFANRNLALVIEARCMEGKLVVCSTDLGNANASRPEARQLRYSLEKYMASEAFAPTSRITPEQLKSLATGD